MSGTLKALAEIASGTGAYHAGCRNRLGFALPAKRLFSPFHRSAAWRDRHGTIEGVQDPQFLQKNRVAWRRENRRGGSYLFYKAQGIGSPHFRTVAHYMLTGKLDFTEVTLLT